MDSGERELEDDLRRAIAEAVAASRPVADELIDVINHVRSELCSAGEGLTPSADESTRELLDVAQGICREIGAQLDDVLHVQLREIYTFNIVLFGRTGTGKSSLIEAISRGNGESVSPGEGDYTKGISSLEWASCRLYDTPGIQGWTSGSRQDLEELARRAVTIADLVLICFDNQNQQDGEFRKVAEWVSASGKPAVAVFNCRNPVWRVPPKTGQRSERVQTSRSTRENADYIRDQLERIGLPGIPVVAVHTLHAFLATATEPLAGKAAAQLEPQLRAKRARYGAARLWQWSNVPALESLIIEALRSDAVALRLGRLVQQVRGTLTEVVERWEEVGVLATAGAESVERGIEQQLAVLGTGEADALAADTTADGFDQLREEVSKLEELRGRPLDAPARGSLALHAKNVISVRVSELRSPARRRADEAIDEARNQRRVLSPEEFDRRVFDQAAVNNAVQEIAEELSTHLDKRLMLVAEDLAVDLHRVVVRGQAGSLLRPAANWVRGAGVVAGGAAGFIALSTAVSTAVTLTPAIAVGLVAAPVLLAVAGGWLHKRAIIRRETALASARADAARAVNEGFSDLQRHLSDQFLAALRAAVVDRVGGIVKSALTLRRIAHTATCQQKIASEALFRIAERGDPIEVLREAARQCENRTQLTGTAAARALWLGESWIDDPDGLTSIKDKPTSHRKPVEQSSFWRRLDDQLRVTFARLHSTPTPGSGRDWLAELTRQAGDDPLFTADITELRALAADLRPRLVLVGDYSAGKSSLIKRLLVEAGTPVPPELIIGAGPTTTRVQGYEWRGMLLIDTPGAQGANPEHGLIAQAAVHDAAGVLYLLNPQLLVGDAGPLRGVLVGAPEHGVQSKRDRTLFIVRSDGFSVDPDDNRDLYLQHCRRKEAELRAQIRNQAPGPQQPDDAVLFVASDPHNKVGQRSGVTRAAYDAHRAWDGVAELRDALESWRPTLLANGMDISVLHGGLARLGRTAARITEEIAAQRAILTQYERLGGALRDAHDSGAAIMTDRRHQLRQRLTDRSDELLNRLLTTPDRDEQGGLQAQLERLEDPVLRQCIRWWRRQTHDEVEEWGRLTGVTIQRRVAAVQFAESTSVAPRPRVDLTNLTHGGNRGVSSALGRALGLGGRLVDRGAKGGATAGKAARFAGRAGGALGLVTAVWEGVSLYRDIKRDREVEHARPALIARLNQTMSDWAGQLADSDPALDQLNQELIEIEKTSHDLARDIARTREHLDGLARANQLCRDQMERARHILQQ